MTELLQDQLKIHENNIREELDNVILENYRNIHGRNKVKHEK
jgi:hypothetical protein